jgi:CRISPR-associated protein Csy2
MSSPESTAGEARALLALSRLRVQNANAISSPLTWGFPSITAFSGLMTALERRLGPQAGVAFYGVGVICHSFEAQVTTEGYTRAFHLTRNPVQSDGSSAAIVEEGRAHLDLTLVFDVGLSGEQSDAARYAEQTGSVAPLAQQVADLVAGMRVAGGSVMPALAHTRPRPAAPLLALVPDDEAAQRAQFRRLARRWLPGFALVSRDDLLAQRLAQLREDEQPNASVLDAWLDLLRWNHRCVAAPDAEPGHPPGEAVAERWQTDPRPGWTVPIPVGYAALSQEVHPAASVAAARDDQTPLRFVESVWSIGQWVSPHRLTSLDALVWQINYQAESGLYRCCNSYADALPFLAAQVADA